MSFRNRLTFFFVVIVIVPMISVAVVLFRLIADNEQGKANAGLSSLAGAAVAIYHQDTVAPDLGTAAIRIARDPLLGQALRAHDTAAATARARQLVASGASRRIVLLSGGRAAIDVGDPTAVAPIDQDLVDSSGRPLGRLETSQISADDYARTVRQLTGGLRMVVLEGTRVLTASAGPVLVDALPRQPQHPVDVRVGGRRYRAYTLVANGFGGQPLRIVLLDDIQSVNDATGGSRLLAGAFIGVFFIIAFAFAVLVSRSLQMQIGGFLEAARRLGSGDFSTQVPTVGHDEFAALGEEFNKMSKQLEQRLEEIREQQGRLEGALRRIGESAASNLDRDALLEIMLRTAVDGVQAAGGRASVRGPDGLEERVRVGRVGGREDALEAVEAAVMESHEPRNLQRNGVSALGHPLPASSEGPVQGMLSVAREDRPFSEREQELFHYLASQAAVSVENVDLHERVQRQAVTDELTGLFNHRRFQEAIASELERSKRFRQDLGLVMIDIDNFKRVNDTYGHQQGDLVLREVARIVREYSREIDAPARYGGEELALVLPSTNLEGAYNLAERVRTGIEDLVIPRLDGHGNVQITASLGVAAGIPDPEAEPQHLIAAADAALYEAKRSGKNRTVRSQ